MPDQKNKKKSSSLILIILIAVLGTLLVALLAYIVLVTSTAWDRFSMEMIPFTNNSMIVLFYSKLNNF